MKLYPQPAASAVAHPVFVGPKRAIAAIVFSVFVFVASLQATQRVTREQVSRTILDEFALVDCAGYLSSHSGAYRRTFAKALRGDMRALRRVFRDPLFHSGDNEAWCSIPGSILYVIGDEQFFTFAMSLPPKERWWALTYLPAAQPFQQPDRRRGLEFFAREFPKTYRLYTESEAQPRPSHAMPFRQPKGPEHAEEERTADRCMTRLNLEIRKQAGYARNQGRAEACPSGRFA